MRADQISFLKQPHIKAVLQSIDIKENKRIKVATDLRKRFSASEVHALIETAILRKKGEAKFSLASKMLFSRNALEQSSGEVISHYRAARFAALSGSRLVDMGCGLGGDALGLAGVAHTIGLDLDRERLLMAQHNLSVYGREDRFDALEANIKNLPPFRADGLFFDPARRTQSGKRVFSMSQYQPPIQVLDRWRPYVPAMAVKVSPGVDYAELPDNASIEFISVDGEVKECVIWEGRFREIVGSSRSATLLPGGATLSVSPRPISIPVTPPAAYLYEPDGAVIRAHLVKELAQQLNLTQIDGQIAYLSGDQLHRSPFVTAFAVRDSFPFGLKRLKRYLADRQIGRLTIKKRGSPIDPDELHQRLKPKGENKATIFLTKIKGEASIIVGDRCLL